jgi:hypothetical protein
VTKTQRFLSPHHQLAWLYSEAEIFVHRIVARGNKESDEYFWRGAFARFYTLPTLWEIQCNVKRVEWSMNYYANEHLFSAHLLDRGVLSLKWLARNDHVLARKYNGICLPDASSDPAVESYCWDSTDSGALFETLVSSAYPIVHESEIHESKNNRNPIGEKPTRSLTEAPRFHLIDEPIPWVQVDDSYYRDLQPDFYLGPGPQTSTLTTEPWISSLPYPYFVNPFRAPLDLGIVTFNTGTIVRRPPLWPPQRAGIGVRNTSTETVWRFVLPS